jgi:hypothetical protein
MINVDPSKKIIESASHDINTLNARDKMVDGHANTPKKLNDPSKDTKRGSELSKERKSKSKTRTGQPVISLK